MDSKDVLISFCLIFFKKRTHRSWGWCVCLSEDTEFLHTWTCLFMSVEVNRSAHTQRCIASWSVFSTEWMEKPFQGRETPNAHWSSMACEKLLDVNNDFFFSQDKLFSTKAHMKLVPRSLVQVFFGPAIPSLQVTLTCTSQSILQLLPWDASFQLLLARSTPAL